jgi:primosomal protein N' (replication factor Y) (superfamily II helicase)
VAGRAGRGAAPGRVLVQTWNAGSPAVACAAEHDFARFAEGELSVRQASGWPPFSRLLAVRVEGTEAGARRCAEMLAAAVRPALVPGHGVSLLGPAPAALERLRGRSRWHLLFRAPGPEPLRSVHRLLAGVAHQASALAQVRFDIDPYSML